MKNGMRKFYLSFLVTSCILFGFLAVCLAYENIHFTRSGEERYAVTVKDGILYFFDYEYEFK
jgi:hypothetical protein